VPDVDDLRLVADGVVEVDDERALPVVGRIGRRVPLDFERAGRVDV